jgi:lysophospholipase L1-like esterase
VTVVAALGDSFTCGEGVGVRVDPAATWVALLADALPGGHLLRLAVPGARVAEVRARQLPLVAGRVDVATLVVGLNDVARPGFDAATVGADLLAVVAGLRGRGAHVVLGRLHDPAALLPLPARVARAVRQRVAAVNAVVDAAATEPAVSVLDLGRVPALAEPGGWAVDRIHPSQAGHRGIAVAAVRELGSGEVHRPVPLTAAAVPPGPSRRACGWWAVRHGLPYAASHFRELGAPLASAVLDGG